MTDQVPAAENLSSTDESLIVLQNQFPNAVRRDDRDGYSGIVVDPARLVEVATYARDRLGYDYL